MAALVALLVMALMMSGGSASAQSRGQMSLMDRHFVLETAAVNMMEIDLGRLAAQRAATPGVRQFGEMMVMDHTKAQQELMSIAAAQGMPFPKDMGTMKKMLKAMNMSYLLVQHMETRDTLAKLPAPLFDMVYIGGMVKGHAKTVASFELEYEGSKVPDLRVWTNKTLPILKQHMLRARSLAEMLADPVPVQ
jgi:putative membrane protein